MAVDALTKRCVSTETSRGSRLRACTRGTSCEAKAILDRFSRGPLAPMISPIEGGMISLGLGDTEATLSSLEGAYAGRLAGTIVAGDFFRSLHLSSGIKS